MSGANRMAGSPWHSEVLRRKEGDPRRHRANCKHFSSKDNYCIKRSMKCVGSAHCKYYRVAPKSTPPLPAKVESPDAVQPFEGIKRIAMANIVVSKAFAVPTQKNVQKILKYYEEHGELDKPVVVSCENSKYFLEDKYLRYFVALILGLDYVPARMGTYKDASLENELRKVGKPVKHKHYGEGRIVNSSLKCVEIKFDSGKTITFDIETCINGNIITPI